MVDFLLDDLRREGVADLRADESDFGVFDRLDRLGVDEVFVDLVLGVGAFFNEADFFGVELAFRPRLVAPLDFERLRGGVAERRGLSLFVAFAFPCFFRSMQVSKTSNLARKRLPLSNSLMKD